VYILVFTESHASVETIKNNKTCLCIFFPFASVWRRNLVPVFLSERTWTVVFCKQTSAEAWEACLASPGVYPQSLTRNLQMSSCSHQNCVCPYNPQCCLYACIRSSDIPLGHTHVCLIERFIADQFCCRVNIRVHVHKHRWCCLINPCVLFMQSRNTVNTRSVDTAAIVTQSTF
jgi:hypothetical protein